MMNKRITASLTALLLSTSSLQSATLLPNGQQQFLNGNGQPYASGTVTFYSNFPTCSVLKNTWSNSGQTVLNTNPVVLDSAGRATIFGSGAYCQVLKDSNNNTIWTKETGDATSTSTLGWGGIGGGTANAQTVTVSGFSSTNGQTFYFVAGASNTGPLTLSVNAGSTIAVVKPTTAGTSQLGGGEVVSGNVVGVTYYSTTGQFQLITNNISNTSGQIAAFGSSLCPSGWLAADGTAVSRTTYASLFASIATTWGNGNGTTTFNLPDLRGTFLRGTGTNANAAVVAAGGAIGQALGTYAADTFQGHKHNVTDPGHFHSLPNGFTVGNIAGAGSAYSLPSAYPAQNTGSKTTGLTVESATTDTNGCSGSTSCGTVSFGTETKPKNFGVTYCIQY